MLLVYVIVLALQCVLVKCTRDDKSEIQTSHAQFMKDLMNESVDPCEDFYKYACGNWAKVQPIEKDKHSSDVVGLLTNKINKFLKEVILENNYENFVMPKKNIEDGIWKDLVKKVRDYYELCKAKKLPYYQPYLKAWGVPGGWPTLNSSWSAENFDIINVTAHLKLYDAPVLFDATVLAHYQNATQNIIYLSPAKFPIFPPNSLAFYSDTQLNSSTMFIKLVLQEMIAAPFSQLGLHRRKIVSIVKDILNFESQLAKLYLEAETDEDEEIPETTLGVWSERFSNLDFNRYFMIISNELINETEPLLIISEKYFEKLENLTQSTDPTTLANFFLYRFSLNIGTSEDTQKESCTNEVILHMGTIVGYIYNQMFNDKKWNDDIQEIAQNVKSAFIENVQESNWVDSKTMAEAEKKLENIMTSVGSDQDIFQDELMNLELDSNDYYQNFFKLLTHTSQKSFNRLHKPSTRNNSDLNPALVNAFYDIVKNKIIIPTNFLQLPVYHYHLPISVKYGVLGSIIGHELTHSLDSTGREWDANGNLVKWWSNSAEQEYVNRSECIKAQYDQYVPTGFNFSLGTVENTLDENISDNGGVRQSYRAYKKWLAENNDINYQLPELNLTHTQLFFLSFAQFFCEENKVASAVVNALIDEHTSGRFRVIGTLSNFKEFSNEFQCSPNASMNPAKRCRIW